MYLDIRVDQYDYNRLYGFVVSPAIYTQYKTDLYNLRDQALWKSGKDDYTNYKTIVKLFHDTALRK
jgi:hypothetical protein